MGFLNTASALLASIFTAQGASIAAPFGSPQFFRGPTPARKSKNKPASYGDIIRTANAAKRAEAMAERRPGLRDKRGAYTLTGGTFELIGFDTAPDWCVQVGVTPNGIECRRKWAAGISAQRGF